MKIIFKALLAFMAILFISWILTCGVIRLITMCFDMEYSWGVATGVWLALMLVSGFFKESKHD